MAIKLKPEQQAILNAELGFKKGQKIGVADLMAKLRKEKK